MAVILFLANSLYAYQGLARIVFPVYSNFSYPGGSISVPYQVFNIRNSTNGTIGYSIINVQDNVNLTVSGITISLTDGFDEAPFNGTMNIGVDNFTKIGTYHIILNATGGLPAAPVAFNLAVINYSTYQNITSVLAAYANQPYSQFNGTNSSSFFNSTVASSVFSSIPQQGQGANGSLSNQSSPVVVQQGSANAIIGYAIIIVIIIIVVGVVYFLRKEQRR